MSSPSASRKRAVGKKDASPAPSEAVHAPSGKLAAKPPSEWDYQLAFVIVTLLAFATRFYKINYPNEVVFDEVHFGKVCIELCSRLDDR